MPEVTFQPKSDYQKENCINYSAEYTCPNKSTLEAVCSEGIKSSAVRCCANEDCKARAAEIALEVF